MKKIIKCKPLVFSYLRDIYGANYINNLMIDSKTNHICWNVLMKMIYDL